MKRALKKNPKLADSSVKYVPYYKDTVVTIQIVGDTSDQSIKFAEWLDSNNQKTSHPVFYPMRLFTTKELFEEFLTRKTS
jgi:hypothetical protein